MQCEMPTQAQWHSFVYHDLGKKVRDLAVCSWFPPPLAEDDGPERQRFQEQVTPLLLSRQIALMRHGIGILRSHREGSAPRLRDELGAATSSHLVVVCRHTVRIIRPCNRTLLLPH